MNKNVLSFTYPNSYNYKIRFCTNDQEDILAIGGQDKKVYLWDLKTGQKLRQIDNNEDCQVWIISAIAQVPGNLVTLFRGMV